ncbi:MAG: hypothetical protein LBD47_09335, partial [Treponema sp.]|nr:hypothetical protein [Treponema sp.]
SDFICKSLIKHFLLLLWFGFQIYSSVWSLKDAPSLCCYRSQRPRQGPSAQGQAAWAHEETQKKAESFRRLPGFTHKQSPSKTGQARPAAYSVSGNGHPGSLHRHASSYAACLFLLWMYRNKLPGHGFS